MNPRITQQSAKQRQTLMNLSEEIEVILRKAAALSAHTFGEESGSGFRDLGAEHQETYLWTISELIRDARKAWGEMNELLVDVRKSPEAA